jgi:hypothetical protein
MPDAPKIIRSEIVLRCKCGEEHEFDGIHDGWQHIYPCACGRRVSVQIDDPIVQYDRVSGVTA